MCVKRWIYAILKALSRSEKQAALSKIWTWFTVSLSLGDNHYIKCPSWRQHPTRHQLYGHLPPITKSIQVRRTRYAEHCWRSRDELIRDVLLWIPTHGRAKAGRPARTYIQQLCEDTGCCPEDLPRAMNDREEWRERVRDIRTTSAIWWWWWYIYWLPLYRKCSSPQSRKKHPWEHMWFLRLYSILHALLHMSFVLK